MRKFITRVELHGATHPEDYEGLHRFMAEVRFSRTIDGDNGLRYKLPSATYSSFGDLPAAVCVRLPNGRQIRPDIRRGSLSPPPETSRGS